VQQSFHLARHERACDPVVVSVRVSDFIRVVFFLAISIGSRHGRHDRSCCGDVSSACSGRPKRCGERPDICRTRPRYCSNRHIGPILAAIRFAGDVDLVSPFRGCFNGFNLDVLAPFGVRLEKTGVDSPSAGTVSSRLRKVSTSSRNERTNNVKVHTGSLDRN